ncbi:MAG: ABC transporter ATP-binding protein [Ruminococcaceae bacterium]|nr:ABC transporter ATP-binding protein [Oscillospiraceae bacterium]
MGVLRLNDVNYSYDKKKFVIKNMCFDFEGGVVYAIVGKSGAGKTTLLSMLSGLTKPTMGEILYDGKNISGVNPYTYRSRYVGVIFQSYNLLPHLTATENVILSMDISGKKIKNKKERAQVLLSSVGLGAELWDRRILKLSGGEQQRVAIARTLAFDPEVILADEPTGNLDGETQEAIMEIFLDLAKNQNKCVIIVTHSPDVAKMADVKYELAKN